MCVCVCVCVCVGVCARVGVSYLRHIQYLLLSALSYRFGCFGISILFVFESLGTIFCLSRPKRRTYVRGTRRKQRHRHIDPVHIGLYRNAYSPVQHTTQPCSQYIRSSWSSARSSRWSSRRPALLCDLWAFI